MQADSLLNNTCIDKRIGSSGNRKGSDKHIKNNKNEYFGLTHLWEDGQVPYQTLIFILFCFFLITPKHTHTHTTHIHTAAQSPSQPSTTIPKTPSQEDTPIIQRRPSNPPTPPPVVYSSSTDVDKNSSITSLRLLPNGGSSQSSQESI